MRIFGKGNCKLIANCATFGKGKCKFIANFSATMVTSLPSLSLSLSVCISLSLSHQKYLTHNIGSAIYNTCFSFFLLLLFFFSSFSSDLLYFSRSRNIREDNLSVGNPTLNNYNNNISKAKNFAFLFRNLCISLYGLYFRTFTKRS